MTSQNSGSNTANNCGLCRFGAGLLFFVWVYLVMLYMPTTNNIILGPIVLGIVGLPSGLFVYAIGLTSFRDGLGTGAGVAIGFALGEFIKILYL